MNNDYVKQAIKKVPDRLVLVRIASERAKDLARGAGALVEPLPAEKGCYLDIALKEIGAGKIIVDPASLEA